MSLVWKVRKAPGGRTGAPAGHRRHQEAPGGPRRHQKASRRQQKASGGLRRPQEATGGPRRPKEATEVGGKGYRQILLSFILKFTGGKCYRQKSFKFFFGKSNRANG